MEDYKTRKGKELAQEMLDYVNAFGFDSDAFADVIIHGHKTLQQSFMRLIIKTIRKMATVTPDDRNAQTVALAKKISEIAVKSPGPGHVPSNKNYGVCIERVIFNDPATIVFWSDGTKTVVKAHGEVFDEEKGLAMAIAKKALGNKGNYYNVFKRFLITDEDLESIGEGPRSSIDAIDEAFDNLAKAFGGKTE